MHVANDFRALLATETPSSDPSLQRLFPPARTDDPVEELEYERKVGDSLLAAKLEQLTVLERCAGSRVLTEEDVLACMRAVNDLRLVMGTRLDVQEDSDPSAFAADPERGATSAMYAYPSWLPASLIDAMGGSGA